MNAQATVKLDFVPATAGKVNYKLYFVCDSYLGSDQEFDLAFRINGTHPALNGHAPLSGRFRRG